MNTGCIIGGALLILVSIFFTIFTLGFGIFCTGPLFLIGLVIFIIGFFISGNSVKEIHHFNTTQPTSTYSSRHCPSCGRSIPFDAQLCPYCGRNF
jgi:hypothetical protein